MTSKTKPLKEPRSVYGDGGYANHIHPYPTLQSVAEDRNAMQVQRSGYPYLRQATRCIQREGKPIIYAGDRIVLKSELDLQKLSYLSNTLLVDEDGHEYHVNDVHFLPMDIDDESLARLERPRRYASDLPTTQPARLSVRFVLHKWWVNLVRICQIPCWTCQYARVIPALDLVLCFHEIQPSIEAWRDTEDQQWNERLGKECPVHNHVEQQIIELEATNMKVWL